MRYKKQRNIFKEGFLTELAEAVLAGKPTSEIPRLTTDEMHKLPEIYASIDVGHSNHLEIPCWDDAIESDKVYKTGNKKEILGKDIRAITSLMYLRPRTAYWKPDKPQIHDSTMSGAVPIPMLGFKRWRGIPYNAWKQSIFLYSGTPQINEDDGTLLIDEDQISDIYEIDWLLGYTLASTKFDPEQDEIVLRSGYGLAALSVYGDEEWRPNYNDVRYFREHNIGNFKGSFASVYGAVPIPDNDEPKVVMHNLCSTPMRLMLSQRWVWYNHHRSPDMIMDFQDWDNVPKSVDQMSTALLGVEPKVEEVNKYKRFGIG